MSSPLANLKDILDDKSRKCECDDEKSLADQVLVHL